MMSDDMEEVDLCEVDHENQRETTVKPTMKTKAPGMASSARLSNAI